LLLVPRWKTLLVNFWLVALVGSPEKGLPAVAPP